MVDFFWKTWTRKIVTTLTSIFLLISALGGAVKAIPDLKPYIFVQKWYVDGEISDWHKTQMQYTDQRIAEYKPVVTQILKWHADDRKAAIEKEQAEWRIKLPTESDPQTKVMIQNRLNQLDNEKLKVDEQMKAIK